MPELDDFELKYYDGKDFILEKDYRYMIGDKLIHIPAGFKCDLASVPRIFRNIINTYGDHTRAAVIHDWLYRNGHKLGVSRKEADKVFLAVMKEQGVGFFKRQLMYRAVRTFGIFAYKKGE
ncbi:DUF1353 domain-containing protein [Fusobacterium polymorphum]|uniref:DUF1353 domain-containing protein n=1 Tax=Fusobacterium nucleatum subsp. polymorphum TaxID=76857 RepID=UPI003008CEDC